MAAHTTPTRVVSPVGAATAGAPVIEITPEMMAAGEAALLDVFPEEVLSWRTPGLKIASCRVYAAMEEARGAISGSSRVIVRVPPEFDL